MEYGFHDIKNRLIIKTHQIDLDMLIDRRPKYDLYFVMTERHIKVNEEHRKYPNVLVIDYSEILETDELSIDDIAANVFAKLKTFLPEIPDKPDEELVANMAGRLRAMNARYEEIKDRPFDYFDPFYHIHGHHRGRNIVHDAK